MCFIIYLKNKLLEKSINCRLPLLTSNQRKQIYVYALSYLKRRLIKTMKEPETMRNSKRIQIENFRGNISQGERMEGRTSIGESCNIQIGQALRKLPAWR